jgi:hypothetical protein
VGETALRVLLVLTASVWVGGLVTLAVVARVAGRRLSAADRVAFFHDLGRSYGVVGGCSLVIALLAGAILLVGTPWTGMLAATVVVAAALVLATATGALQARRMTRLRQRSACESGDLQLAVAVRRGAVSAAGLRGVIGALSIALVVLRVLLAG